MRGPAGHTGVHQRPVVRTEQRRGPYPHDEATQQRLALECDETVKTSIVTVDGYGRLNVRDPLYGALSPQKSAKLPAPNFFGVPPKRITLSAHGWVVFVLDLAPGIHAIRSYNTFDDGSVYDFTKYVNVIPG